MHFQCKARLHPRGAQEAALASAPRKHPPAPAVDGLIRVAHNKQVRLHWPANVSTYVKTLMVRMHAPPRTSCQ